MTLSDQQFEFIKDVGLLIHFISNSGWKVTGNELYRPAEMQRIYFDQGKSKTLDSLHQDKLAIDLNLFHPEKGLTYEKKDLQQFGDFWESLNDRNEWGGNWEFLDTIHFQRNKL